MGEGVSWARASYNAVMRVQSVSSPVRARAWQAAMAARSGYELGAPGDLERDVRLAQRPLGAHDALRQRRFRDEERPGDLVGREATQQAQGERHARLG